MIETRIRVIRAAGGTAWVQPSEDSGCGGCGARSSCAVSGLAKYFARRQRSIPVACDRPVQAGDELVVTVSESQLLKAGLMAYLLPAVLAVLGASLAALQGLSDAGTAGGMAAGVIMGLLIARLLGGTSKLDMQRNPHPSEGEAP